MIEKYAKSRINLLLLAMILINLLFRLIYIFYGYIATEEGILITNQKLAYSGLIPFRDYNGWNSFLNDYFIGLFHYLLKPTILNQRFVGLAISLGVLLLTLITTKFLKNKTFTFITLFLLTFGAYPYLYYSNIPYAGLLMTFFIMLSLVLISKNLNNKKPVLLFSILSIIFITLAGITYIQGLPVTFLTWLYFMYLYRKNKKVCISITIILLIVGLSVLLPTVKNFQDLAYFIMIPLRVNNYLIYQLHNTSYTFTKILNYFQVLLRDYGIFILIISGGLIQFFINLFITNDKETRNKYFHFIVLLSVISIYFLFSGLLHKSAYPNYIQPSVPVLSILSAFFMVRFLSNLKTLGQKFFFLSIISLYLLNNTLNFSHYKFIKTSLLTINKTPHAYLADIALFIKEKSKDSDIILSFYSPLVIASERFQNLLFNMDRYSMTVLPDKEAIKYHLVTNRMLTQYIASREAKIIAFTDKNISQFGKTEEEQKRTLNEIIKNYDLIKEYEDINKIEDPKTKKLFIYLRKD